MSHHKTGTVVRCSVKSVVGMARTAVAAGALVPLLGACASTPESLLRDELWAIYWDSARACGRNHTNFYVENVKLDGAVTVVGHTSAGIEGFRACYWRTTETGFEKRRAGGLPIPSEASMNPPVDIELD